MKFTLIPLSVVVTIAGLTRPEFAGRGIQLLIASTVATVVVSMVQTQWSRSESQVARPFVSPEPPSGSGMETPDVSELVRAIESSDGRLPSTIAKHVADACRGRLADHHRLHVHNASDQQRIQDLIGPAMWTLISATPGDSVDLPIHNLAQLLDEVEAL